MTKASTSVNLGLSTIPEYSQDKYPGPFVDSVRVRNAINLLASYLDSYTGNSGTGVSAFANGRVAVGNGTGWTSFPELTFNGTTGALNPKDIVGSALAMAISPKVPTSTEVAGYLTIASQNAIQANGNGGDITVKSGNGLGLGNGGNLALTAGSSTSGNGGGFSFFGGAGVFAGSFYMAGGTGTTQGGGADIIGGSASNVSGFGGSVTIQGGSATNNLGIGANVSLIAGTGGVGGSGGNILINTTGAGTGVEPQGTITIAGGSGFLPAITITDNTAAALIGFFNAAPKIQAGPFTKTYSVASRTVPNATFAALATTAATNVTPYGFTTAAQANAIATQVNALAADVLILKQLIVALINDLSSTLGIGINAT
jgi:hypothetical protein